MRILYLGPDCTDVAVARRMSGFRHAGVDAVAATFRRKRYSADFNPFWEHIDLGELQDRAYGARLLALGRTIKILLGRDREIADVDCYWARNLDMLLVARLLTFARRRRLPIVYEVLDLQDSHLSQSVAGKTMRWLERRLLKGVSLLVVSSPAYVREYFRKVQHSDVAAHVLENKVVFGSLPRRPQSVESAEGAASPRVWTIGWFGTLRCRDSLATLCSLADRLGDRVKIVLRGKPMRFGMAELLHAVDARQNVEYLGEYRAPDELGEIYGSVDLNWCVDHSDRAGNSKWLMPNRFYEGGYFGVPAIGETGAQVGETVARKGIGWVFEDLDDLARLLGEMTESDYAAVRNRLLEVEPTEFCESDGDGTKAAVDSLLATMADPGVDERSYAAPCGQVDAG